MNYKTKVILGGVMGNLVEAYDIAIGYFLASELSVTLINPQQQSQALVLLLFFIAYLAKPLGAIILGTLSDQLGRKNVLMASIIIMGISTTLIGFIPTQATIGIYSGLLLLLLRIIQSMALGSEFLNSASFLIESGDDKQRGFRGCWPSVGVKLGFFVASIVVAANHHYHLSWRIPFFLAFVTTTVGFYVRLKMPESLAYIEYYSSKEKPSAASLYKQCLSFIKKYPFLFSYAFTASFISVATNFFFYLYAPLHAISYSSMPPSFIIFSNILSLAWVAILIPLFGKLSDSVPRLTLLQYAVVGLLILAYPYVHAMQAGNPFFFLVMQCLIAIPCACYYGVSSVILTELFPIQIRCTVLSIIFSFAASLAAGIPPLLADYLARKTPSSDSSSLIIIVITFLMLLLILRLKNRYSSYVLESVA